MLGELEEDFLLELAHAEADRRWGNAEELIALVAELLHEQTRVLIRLLGGKSSQVPKPLHVPRPGEETTPTMSIGEMARRMARG